MSMLLTVAGLVLGAILGGFVWGGGEHEEMKRQADWDQPNPRGGLR